MDENDAIAAKLKKVETLDDLLNFIEDLEQYILNDEDFSKLSLTNYFDAMQTEMAHVHPDRHTPYRLVARLLYRTLFYT